nr:MAG TPA: hypothetical protein [Caudoviricetes sp.]
MSIIILSAIYTLPHFVSTVAIMSFVYVLTIFEFRNPYLI